MGFTLSWRKQKTSSVYPSPPPNFEGRFYNKNPGIDWAPYIPIQYIPITYLEIGVADGGNAIYVADSFCKHPDSKLYCIDPWMDYEEYPEYKGKQEIGWKTFNKNIENSGHFSKFIVNRGFSDDIVPAFPNQFFDIIFVDGNHETDFVYRDGQMALDKVKLGGYIIFDDYTYGWPQTVKGIEMFLDNYSSKIRVLMKDQNRNQAIVQKILN
jgi:predicted O-methyltransferase YrrM